MSFREITGLAFLVMAFATAPFAYWLNAFWGIVAVLFAIPGCVLMATGRASRKLSERRAFNDFDTSVDAPPGVHDVKGYPGALVFDNNHDHVDTPDHG